MKSQAQLRRDVIRLIQVAILMKETACKKGLDDAEMSRIMTVLITQQWPSTVP